MQFQQFRPQRFNVLPPIVKNLLIINILVYFFTITAEEVWGINIVDWFGLHYFTSDLFRPHQLITYMFMHGGFDHVFFNMFALWMFGNVLENVWGPKRFLIYYMITGIGAGLIQLLVNYISLQPLYEQLSPALLDDLKNNGALYLSELKNFTDPVAAKINLIVNSVTVGASGSVFGVLLAFGMLFPNTQIFIYFLFPIKAKYFVILYGAMELFLGIANNQGDNVAHFAHLGGMLFGFIMIKLWSNNRKKFY
jgi:membrane associated rhomboid family serine protease